MVGGTKILSMSPRLAKCTQLIDHKQGWVLFEHGWIWVGAGAIASELGKIFEIIYVIHLILSNFY